MVDLTSKICGVRLSNPTVLPAGIVGVSASTLLRAASSGAGAVTSKSIGPERRGGHSSPVVVEVCGGLLNAVGLSCPSLDESLCELGKAVNECRVPVIASIYGRSVEEYAMVAERVSMVKPSFVEVNISCPNVSDEFGRCFSSSPGLAGEVTAAVKEVCSVPVMVKLSPNVSDIKEVASAVEDAGVDCISAINTLGPGMVIDVYTCRPVLSNRFGGMSGPAVKPIAVRCVYEIFEVVDVPVIGMGGVETGLDVVEMIMAGASAVGVGTAVWRGGFEVFSRICSELKCFMEANGYSSVKDLVGLAHR